MQQFLKHSNFKHDLKIKIRRTYWRTLEMLYFNCETKVVLTWSGNCVICEKKAEKTLQNILFQW